MSKVTITVRNGKIYANVDGKKIVVEREKRRIPKARANKQQARPRHHNHRWDFDVEQKALICISCRKRRDPIKLRSAGTRRRMIAKQRVIAVTGGLAAERRY